MLTDYIMNGIVALMKVTKSLMKLPWKSSSMTSTVWQVNSCWLNAILETFWHVAVPDLTPFNRREDVMDDQDYPPSKKCSLHCTLVTMRRFVPSILSQHIQQL